MVSLNIASEHCTIGRLSVQHQDLCIPSKYDAQCIEFQLVIIWECAFFAKT